MPATPATPVAETGADCLRLATALLQLMRNDSPTGGIWEAADVQWWSRQERVTDENGQLFWLDEHGSPQAAVLTHDFWAAIQCDVLLRPPTDHDLARVIWRTAIGRADSLRAKPVEFPVRHDDVIGITALTGAGFTPQAGCQRLHLTSATDSGPSTVTVDSGP